MILEATLTVRYTVTDDEALRVYGTTDPAKVAAFDAEDLPGMELRLVPFDGTEAVIRAAQVRVVTPSPVPPAGSQAPSGVIRSAPDAGPAHLVPPTPVVTPVASDSAVPAGDPPPAGAPNR